MVEFVISDLPLAGPLYNGSDFSWQEIFAGVMPA